MATLPKHALLDIIVDGDEKRIFRRLGAARCIDKVMDFDSDPKLECIIALLQTCRRWYIAVMDCIKHLPIKTLPNVLERQKKRPPIQAGPRPRHELI